MTRHLPPVLIDSLEGLPGFDRAAFLAAHGDSVYPTSLRFNPAKSGAVAAGPKLTPVPWCSRGFYLETRPSFILDPAWHAGLYYVQEASGMFIERALLTCAPSGPLRVLDACAAPGGKSTHLQSLLGPSDLLVCNEAIRNRVPVLKENLSRWGADNVVVTNDDPGKFEALPGFFNFMLVDAPCSGSGLFRRDPEATREWSPEAVRLCSLRQRRILADLWGSLGEGGVLVYSTCSYSREEDEDILDYLLDALGAEPLRVDVDPGWGIAEAPSRLGGYGYRFYPGRVDGEGLFVACVRKPGACAGGGLALKPLEGGSKSDHAELSRWLTEPGGYRFIRRSDDEWFAFPLRHEGSLADLERHLRVVRAGIPMGQLIRSGLIPDPALALSTGLAPEVRRLAVGREDAIRYIRKESLQIPGAPPGWTLITSEGLGLGWVKVVPGRINNYYPREWRVLTSAQNPPDSPPRPPSPT